eukprot:5827190-Ditylum_brightwellii.AAC.1
MAAAALLEWVPTSSAVKPSRSLPMRDTVALMLASISDAMMGVAGETDGMARRHLTVSSQARTGHSDGSPDLCM